MRCIQLLALLVVVWMRDLSAQPGAASARPLLIFFGNVGQGDAAHIVTPEGKSIVIDAGPSALSAQRMFFEWTRDTVDLLIASHNHADHIGGMPWIFQNLVVRAYMESGIPHTTNVYASTLLAARKEPGLQYFEATARTIRLGSVTLRILPPARADDSQNNNSVGVVLEYGSFRAIFAGDAEVEQLQHWVRTVRPPRVNVLKASHHGADNGVTEDWIAATRPDDVIVSVSGTNSFGHPSLAALRAWERAGANVFRTDIEGAIWVIVYANGNHMVQTNKRNVLSAPITVPPPTPIIVRPR